MPIHAHEVLTPSHALLRSAGVLITVMCVSDKFSSNCLVRSVAQLAATQVTTLATFSNAANVGLFSLQHWLYLLLTKCVCVYTYVCVCVSVCLCFMQCATFFI